MARRERVLFAPLRCVAQVLHEHSNALEPGNFQAEPFAGQQVQGEPVNHRAGDAVGAGFGNYRVIVDRQFVDDEHQLVLSFCGVLQNPFAINAAAVRP